MEYLAAIRSEWKACRTVWFGPIAFFTMLLSNAIKRKLLLLLFDYEEFEPGLKVSATTNYAAIDEERCEAGGALKQCLQTVREVVLYKT